MNSTRATIIGLILLSAIAAGPSYLRIARAQQSGVESTAGPRPTADPKTPNAGTAPQPAEESNPAAPNATVAPSKLGPWVRERIAPINRLRQAIYEKIDLRSEQKAAIARLFDDFVEDTKNNEPSRWNDPNKPPNRVFPPDRHQRERMLRAARQAGDTAAVERISGQIAAVDLVRLPFDEDYSPVLIEKINAELTPDQARAFQTLVEHWRAVDRPRPPAPRPGPYQMLRRSLLDPEVGLSEEDKAMVIDILNATFRSVSSDIQGPDTLAQAVEKARVTILERISPEQRRKAEAKLEELKAREKRWEQTGDPAPTSNDQSEKEGAEPARERQSPEESNPD